MTRNVWTNSVADIGLPRPSTITWLANLRSALVLLHVTIVCIAAVPTSRGSASREQLATPAARTELRLWGGRLGVSPESLANFALQLADSWDRAYAHVFRPIAPYLAITGTYQPWAVFIAPNRWPSRFQISVHRSHTPLTELQIVFEEGSAEYAWHGRALSQERGRVYFELEQWPRFSFLGPSVCKWAARHLFEERKDIDSVHCRTYRAPARSPEQVARRETVTGEWLDVYHVWR